MSTALAVVAILLFSPLLWFHQEIAEIYPSELLVSLVVVFTAWRAARGRNTAIYACAVALAVAMAFKITAAVLTFPAAAYAWTRVPAIDRRRALLLFGVLGGAVVASFLVVQHDLPAVLWQQFVSQTARSRLVGGEAAVPLRSLNRNIRDTLLAAGGSLGLVNAVGLLAWGVFDRKLPRAIDKWLVALWLGPWLFVLVFIHIGRPGYFLPLVPPLCLILGTFYARQRRSVAVTLDRGPGRVQHRVPHSRRTGITGHDGRVHAVSSEDMATARRKRSATPHAPDCVHPCPVRRARSRPAGVCRDFLSHAGADCHCRTRAGGLAEGHVVLPVGPTVFVTETEVAFTARDTDVSGVPPGGVSFSTECPVIWLAADEGMNTVKRPQVPTETIPHLGWTTAAGTITVTPTTIIPNVGGGTTR